MIDENYTDDSTENIKLVHLTHFLQQLPTILFGQITSALVVTYLVYGRVPSFFAITWISLFVLVVALRTGLYIYHVRHPNTVENRARRLVWHTVSSGAMALLWGVMAYTLIDRDNEVLSLVIVMVLLGLVASSVASTANVRQVFIVFSQLTMLPAVLKFLQLGGSHYTFLGLLILFFLFIVTQFEKGVHNSLTESIRLRFNNVKLIENLTQEKLRALDSQRNAEIALKDAESANKAKSQFLAAASHDLRQPLHALRLLSTTLESTELNNHQAPIVDNIASSVHSLEDLFNSLLDISKLDAGTQSVENNTVYLSDIYNNIQRNYAALAAERGIQFSVEDTNVIVCTDIILLERLIANLVSNAIRYTPKGTIEVATFVENERCIIEVRDTGLGISEEDHLRVFDEFVQLDNPERDRSKGIGLGLAIVKRTADLLDIPLSLQSNVGVGSTFRISVPLGIDSDLNVVDLPRDVSDNDLDGMLVLVIDDEISARTALDGLLDSWGCVGLLASDGDEAERVIREIDTAPDAIIADLRLRDNETGVEVIQRVHNMLDAKCPALIMTGDIAPSRLREIQDASYPIFHKPCDPQKLRQFLSSVS